MTISSPSADKSRGQNRAYALDALRGFAILAMLLSGQLPFDEHALPAWMYHAQVPPPNFEWNPHVYGITWVDLVFPFFLFSMGAAFPLAFARRMEQRTPAWKLAWFILERGFLLGFFALYVEAIRPYILSNHPTAATYWLALLGFFLLFPILTRLPQKWPAILRGNIKAVGWLGALLFLLRAHYPENSPHGPGFSLERSDIIIIVLANMAVFGSVIWILTRKQLLPRLGVLGILLAIRLSNMPQPVDGWVSELWQWPHEHFKWIYRLYYTQYLCIVIPGTIAGDLILQWIRQSQSAAATDFATVKSWSLLRLMAICAMMFAFVLELVIGLKARWLLPTTLTTFVLCGLGWWLMAKPGDDTERLFKSLFLWASYWLILGLFFEPYEGGIRKDKATVSYYFITSGLANCVLIGFSIIIDVFNRRRWLQLLIDNGQNPMIAYAGINNFIIPILGLTYADHWLNDFVKTPWRGFLRGVIITLLMGITVSFLTRRKIFWRT
jgi:predicted acyltransferase